MTVLLGVDTGGTYTDAVLVEDDETVLASAKSLTTRNDLAQGIGASVAVVVERAGIDPASIAMAALSTTLATNALVEGHGGRVALVYIGFNKKDLATHGLTDALAGDPSIVLDGGHTHAGVEAAPLDCAALSVWIASLVGVSAFAVASQFGTRNPEHELKAAEIIRAATGAPVSCSHHLSAKLNGPKRALTALLNARLIGMIDRLIGRAQDALIASGVNAPLMVVRGDGALISAAMARERPIETILSGPAASIVGARWLTGAEHALVSDIGGTTTDVAVLRNGRPAIDSAGAQVGPYRTMVEAVAMRTSGLGGDSEVHFIAEGLKSGVTLGPRRVLPVSLLAVQASDIVHATLERQLGNPVPGEYDGCFVRRVGPTSENDPQEGQIGGLEGRDAAVLARIADGVQPLDSVLKTRLETRSLQRLLARGLVQLSSVTPSDASHVLGLATFWDCAAARKALQLFGRRRTGAGESLAKDPAVMAKAIVDQLTRQTELALLETAFDAEETPFGLPATQLAQHVLTQRGLDGHRGLLALNAGLNVPVIGLGASASTYYPAVGTRLGCEMILPRHAGVANAIGAVVGRVTLRKTGVVTSPSEGCYRVHFETGPQDLADAETAMALLEDHLRGAVTEAALTAGAGNIQITAQRDIRRAQTEAREVFLEATIQVEASGRPRIAG